MPPVARVKRRLAYQPMHAGFGAQPAVGVFALHLDAGTLDSRDLTRIGVNDFAREAASRAPAQVHAQQHLRPVLSLGPAGTGLDVEEGAVRVHLLVEHAFELETPHIRLQRLRIRLDRPGGGLIVLALGHLEKLSGIRDALAGPIDLLHGCRQSGALAPELLRPLLVGPDGRILELAGNFLEPLLFLVVLKETPEGKQYAPRDPSAVA